MIKTYKKSDIDKYIKENKNPNVREEDEINELVDSSGAMIDKNDNFRATPSIIRSKKTSDDFQNFRFNTAIAAMMSFRNVLKNYPEAAGSKVWDECLETLLLMLAPIAPHITEELWHKIKPGRGSVHQQLWPKYDKELATEEIVTLVLQVNGKVRANILFSKESDKNSVLSKCKEHPNVVKYLDKGQLIKEIYIPEKLVSFVIK